MIGQRSFREGGAATAYVPGDELPDDRRPVSLTGEAAELVPQLDVDPDGSVRSVGALLVDRGMFHV